VGGQAWRGRCCRDALGRQACNRRPASGEQLQVWAHNSGVIGMPMPLKSTLNASSPVVMIFLVSRRQAVQTHGWKLPAVF
jgi:hypothetical protein